MNFFRTILILASLNVFGYDSVRVNITGRLRPFEKSNEAFQSKRALHLELMEDDNGVMEVKSPNSFSVFINNQLIDSNLKSARWKLDSLKFIYVFPITISVFSKSGASGLSVELISYATERTSAQRGNQLLSIITLVVFLLVWVLILLLYTNGPVTAEYFYFIKIFSIRNIDEGIHSLRVTSFNNIFVYIFCSALAAVNLTLIGLDPVTHLTGFTLANTAFLTSGILAVLLTKIFLISISARIFNLSEVAPSQFFNFVKLVLGCFLISSVSLILIFILDGDKDYWKTVIGIFILIMLGLYLAATFLRLINKGGFTVFHLFSYLCISEIFPVLLLLKVYYF